MTTPVALAVLLIGLAVLPFAADQFVIGSARLSKRLRIPAVVIGAVVIGFGTSAPEMVVSVLAGLRGEADIAAGNIIGSNLTNLTLVLGVAGLVTVTTAHASILRREAPISLMAAIAFAFALQGGINRIEGVLMLLGLALALMSVLVATRDDGEIAVEVDEYVHGLEINGTHEVLRTIIGLIGTVGGSELVVRGASALAENFEVSGGVVGLTLIAVGTSLPELATTVIAARKNETDLIIGNLFGSNLFNSLAVGGLVGTTAPQALQDPSIADLPTWIMLGGCTLALAVLVARQRIGRPEGALLVASWIGAMWWTVQALGGAPGIG